MKNEEKEKLLNEAIPDQIQSRKEVIRFMIDNRFVSNTFLRDLEIFYTYREKRCHGNTYATISTQHKTGVSERTVYRARQRVSRNIKRNDKG